MDKTAAGVVADPANLQGHSRTFDGMQVNPREGDVDRPADEVEALLGNMAAAARQERVVGRGPVAGDDVDLVVSPQPAVDQVEEFDGIYVHDGLLVGEVATQNPVYCIEGFDVIGSVGSPEGNCEPFFCVGVEE